MRPHHRVVPVMPFYDEHCPLCGGVEALRE
jgi:hypothetical protein